MPSSYSLKTIRVEVALGQGVFSEGGNTVVIEGLGVDVSVTKPGLPEKNSATVKIYGLKYDVMAQLTTLAFKPLESQKNQITIYAGEKDKQLAMVFRGDVTSAFADFNSAPDICMSFEADTGTFPQQIASPVLTTDGDTSIESLFQNFAKEAGYSFRNDGVSGSVKNVWVPGSPISKAEKLAKDLGINLIIDDNEMIISPVGKAKTGNAVFLSAETGLIGYPTFNQDGIQLRCVYNPGIEFNGLVSIQSIVPKATGTWRVTKLAHSITAYLPDGGNWETQIDAMYYNSADGGL